MTRYKQQLCSTVVVCTFGYFSLCGVGPISSRVWEYEIDDG